MDSFSLTEISRRMEIECRRYNPDHVSGYSLEEIQQIADKQGFTRLPPAVEAYLHLMGHSGRRLFGRLDGGLNPVESRFWRNTLEEEIRDDPDAGDPPDDLLILGVHDGYEYLYSPRK